MAVAWKSRSEDKTVCGSPKVDDSAQASFRVFIDNHRVHVCEGGQSPALELALSSTFRWVLGLNSGCQACRGSAFVCWAIWPALFFRVPSFLWPLLHTHYSAFKRLWKIWKGLLPSYTMVIEHDSSIKTRSANSTLVVRYWQWLLHTLLFSVYDSQVSW